MLAETNILISSAYRMSASNDLKGWNRRSLACARVRSRSSCTSLARKGSVALNTHTRETKIASTFQVRTNIVIASSVVQASGTITEPTNAYRSHATSSAIDNIP